MVSDSFRQVFFLTVAQAFDELFKRFHSSKREKGTK
jgi:hypothetical protein